MRNGPVWWQVLLGVVLVSSLAALSIVFEWTVPGWVVGVLYGGIVISVLWRSIRPAKPGSSRGRSTAEASFGAADTVQDIYLGRPPRGPISYGPTVLPVATTDEAPQRLDLDAGIVVLGPSLRDGAEDPAGR